MTISELAKACGVGVETIRYYERRGLIPDPRPKKVGYREFSSEDVRRVRFVKQAQALGFTLKEIAELLALKVSPSSTCKDVRAVARAKLQDIEEKLEALQRGGSDRSRPARCWGGRSSVDQRLDQSTRLTFSSRRSGTQFHPRPMGSGCLTERGLVRPREISTTSDLG